MNAGDSAAWRIEYRPSPRASAKVLVPPISKSDAQRALVLAHVLGKPDWAHFPGEERDIPEDVRATRRGLEQLRLPGSNPLDIQCGDGGAPLRLLLGQAAVAAGRNARLWGSARLAERPHGPLLKSLRAALEPVGLEIREGHPWPVEVKGAVGQAPSPRFSVHAAESSQYATSLLFAAAALHLKEKRDWSVEQVGPATSLGYLELTLAWMERAGFLVDQRGAKLFVRGWEPRSDRIAVPGDWSSLGYLLLVAWKTGAGVAGVDLTAHHPDQAVVRILQKAGLELAGNRVVGSLRSGIQASGAECPDLLPTLAALACVAPSRSHFKDVDILKAKESDRLAGIVDMVAAFGARAEYRDGALEIEPAVRKVPVARVDSRSDHRMAMSAAVACALTGIPLELTQPECVSKSFPGFWEQMESAGISIFK